MKSYSSNYLWYSKHWSIHRFHVFNILPLDAASQHQSLTFYLVNFAFQTYVKLYKRKKVLTLFKQLTIKMKGYLSMTLNKYLRSKIIMIIIKDNTQSKGKYIGLTLVFPKSLLFFFNSGCSKISVSFNFSGKLKHLGSHYALT